ncbi:MAG: hypothetical protein GY720_05465 [bacterium]|nr:hypothetical protein [bacterium]
MSPAQQDEVVDVGPAERFDPSVDVMCVTPLWFAVAGGESTVSVTDGERPTLCIGGESGGTTHVEDN